MKPQIPQTPPADGKLKDQNLSIHDDGLDLALYDSKHESDPLDKNFKT